MCEDTHFFLLIASVHPSAEKRDAAHRKLDIELEVRAASDQR